MEKTENTLQFYTNFEHHNKRLDGFLSYCLSGDYSRSFLQKLILDGQVKVNGKTINKVSYKLQEKDIVEIEIPELETAEIVPQKMDLEIVYEDEHLLVVNKPAGLTVHPGAGQPDGTLINGLMEYCKGSLSGIGGVERPGIVHRIDKGTSGLLVVAKDDHSHQELAKQFAEKTTHRSYVALVYGILPQETGTIIGNIARDPKNRKRMAFVENKGKEAKTTFRVLNEYRNCVSLVKLKLYTGRTHQIRVHMTSVGNNLIGDPIYGKMTLNKNLADEQKAIIKSIDHQMLHAMELGFKHPETGKFLKFKVAPPEDFQKLINILKK
ncbi:MAG: RluA family pseudouridine synthase [Proteobacteria bacterium]|nr:RluA family pseudouridine synthase [Pseudomonadota bacterium]